MRISPLHHACFYFIVGSVFLYFAFQSIEATVLNPITILLALVTSFNYGLTVRLIKLHFKIKQYKKNTKK
ncbi:protein of unknown function [Amphibacillus marinus]|uniref:DUF4305 domain-containing protein n=1 Tax=Amphibacillus marinus TaxID=872970 RepID=A0A1H8KYD0_9BACI|nr:DUF4305 domain-containing protein [Amphibacillus marinus]SEN97895.1 protein of unknown function [Amphibacillus marinus]